MITRAFALLTIAYFGMMIGLGLFWALCGLCG